MFEHLLLCSLVVDEHQQHHNDQGNDLDQAELDEPPAKEHDNEKEEVEEGGGEQKEEEQEETTKKKHATATSECLEFSTSLLSQARSLTGNASSLQLLSHIEAIGRDKGRQAKAISKNITSSVYRNTAQSLSTLNNYSLGKVTAACTTHNKSKYSLENSADNISSNNAHDNNEHATTSGDANLASLNEPAGKFSCTYQEAPPHDDIIIGIGSDNHKKKQRSPSLLSDQSTSSSVRELSLIAQLLATRHSNSRYSANSNDHVDSPPNYEQHASPQHLTDSPTTTTTTTTKQSPNNSNNEAAQEPTSETMSVDLFAGGHLVDKLIMLSSDEEHSATATSDSAVNCVEPTPPLTISEPAASEAATPACPPPPPPPPPPVTPASGEEADLNLKKKRKLDEYYRIEEKQARLLSVLATDVYRKLVEEQQQHQQRLYDPDEMTKVFYVVVELEPFALRVHEQIATQVRHRVEHEWSEKPYFGDIITTYYHYYKVYKAILERYPTCQITLSTMLKKKAFAASLKRLLEAAGDRLDNINRLDMLLDRLVDLPRRSIQLLESYLKLLDKAEDEYVSVKRVHTLLTDIFASSNDALNKMNNFQQCYELQYMFEPPLLSIINQTRQLIKHGQLFKVAKRSGELLFRHLALFTDMLLVCQLNMRRKLSVKYQIPSAELKLNENSNENEPLMFRIISSDQNNEYKAE